MLNPHKPAGHRFVNEGRIRPRKAEWRCGWSGVQAPRTVTFSVSLMSPPAIWPSAKLKSTSSVLVSTLHKPQIGKLVKKYKKKYIVILMWDSCPEKISYSPSLYGSVGEHQSMYWEVTNSIPGFGLDSPVEPIGAADRCLFSFSPLPPSLSFFLSQIYKNIEKTDITLGKNEIITYHGRFHFTQIFIILY